MKILIPTNDYPPIEGGISTVTLQLARELSKLGHEVTVVAPHFSDMAEFDATEPYRVIRFRGYHLSWFRFFPLLTATLPRLSSADCVLSINIAYGGVIGALGQRIFGTPYVTFGYAYEFLRFRHNPPFAALLRMAYRRSKFVVAISQFTCEKLIEFGVPADKIDVILPGAPDKPDISAGLLQDVRQRYVLNGGPVILAVGRMVARKGHVTLVDAMPAVLAQYPDALLVCVGRGPSMSDITRRAQALGIRDHVRLPGRLPDEEVAAFYELCHLFALPTGQDSQGQVEGFGLVFSEAHAHAKPVVAGRSGGVVDAVLDGETGLLVSPDDPEALSDAILQLLDDPDLATRLGDAGRVRVEQELNWETFTQSVASAIEGRT